MADAHVYSNSRSTPQPPTPHHTPLSFFFIPWFYVCVFIHPIQPSSKPDTNISRWCDQHNCFFRQTTENGKKRQEERQRREGAKRTMERLVTHPKVDIALAARQDKLAVAGRRWSGLQSTSFSGRRRVVWRRAHSFAWQTCADKRPKI